MRLRSSSAVAMLGLEVKAVFPSWLVERVAPLVGQVRRVWIVGACGPAHPAVDQSATVWPVLADKVAASATASAFTPSSSVTGSAVWVCTALTKAFHSAS